MVCSWSPAVMLKLTEILLWLSIRRFAIVWNLAQLDPKSHAVHYFIQFLFLVHCNVLLERTANPKMKNLCESSPSYVYEGTPNLNNSHAWYYFNPGLVTFHNVLEQTKADWRELGSGVVFSWQPHKEEQGRSICTFRRLVPYFGVSMFIVLVLQLHHSYLKL